LNIHRASTSPCEYVDAYLFSALAISTFVKNAKNIDNIVKQYIVLESIFHREIVSLFEILIVIIVKGLGVANYTEEPLVYRR